MVPVVADGDAGTMTTAARTFPKTSMTILPLEAITIPYIVGALPRMVETLLPPLVANKWTIEMWSPTMRIYY